MNTKLNVFYIWYSFIDEEERLQFVLEFSFRQSNGNTISYKYEGMRIRSDNWVKKFIKLQIPDLSKHRIKLINTNKEYYVPTIFNAMADSLNLDPPNKQEVTP
jgi:hypothetical protein